MLKNFLFSFIVLSIISFQSQAQIDPAYLSTVTYTDSLTQETIEMVFDVNDTGKGLCVEINESPCYEIQIDKETQTFSLTYKLKGVRQASTFTFIGKTNFGFEKLIEINQKDVRREYQPVGSDDGGEE